MNALNNLTSMSVICSVRVVEMPGESGVRGRGHPPVQRFCRRQLPWSATDTESRSRDAAPVRRYTTARAPRAGAIATPR
jgi:hypothetical protein